MDRYPSVGALWNLNVVGGPELQEEDMEDVFAQRRSEAAAQKKVV